MSTGLAEHSAPPFLRYQLRPVQEGLTTLGWDDRAIYGLPKYLRRHLDKIVTAAITPQDWTNWQLAGAKRPSMSVLLTALEARLDKDEAALWALAPGTVAARITECRWAAGAGLTFAQYDRLRLRWGTVENYRDFHSMHTWYDQRKAAGVTFEVATTWNPRTPLWVARWASTGEVRDIPTTELPPLRQEDIWSAAELAVRLGEVPMEVLVWAADLWAGGLAQADHHAEQFPEVNSPQEWARVQMLPVGRAHFRRV